MSSARRIIIKLHGNEIEIIMKLDREVIISNLTKIISAMFQWGYCQHLFDHIAQMLYNQSII